MNSNSIFDGKRLSEIEKTLPKFLKNIDALDEDYYPNRILFRDREIEDISREMLKFVKFNSKRHILVYGMKGTGKTHAMHVIKNMFREYFEMQGITDTEIIYVSVKNKSFFEALLEIVRAFSGNKNFKSRSISELSSIITDYVEGGDKKYILILDEINTLRPTYGFENPVKLLFYDLTKKGKEPGLRRMLQVIGITNSLAVSNMLEDYIFTEHAPHKVIFERYTEEQVRAIIEDRCKMAFVEGAVEFGAISYLTAVVASGKRDLRWAFNTLKEAVNMAEDKITYDIIVQAASLVDKREYGELIRSLAFDHIAVLVAILFLRQYHTAVETMQMYNLYKKICDATGLPTRTKRHIVGKIISDLEVANLINVYGKGRGRGKGKTLVYDIGDIPETAINIIKEVAQEKYGIPNEFLEIDISKL